MAELFFGDFRLDTKGLVLEGSHGIVEVRPKALRLLTYLIAHRNRFVAKDELMRELWPEVRVTDASVAQCVSELRHLLDDSAREPRYIETRVKHGYRFVAPVFHRPTQQLEPLLPPPEMTGVPGAVIHRRWLARAAGVLAVAAIAVGWLSMLRSQDHVWVVAVPPATTDGADARVERLLQSFREDVVASVGTLPDVVVVTNPAGADPRLALELHGRSIHGFRIDISATLRRLPAGDELWGWTWRLPADTPAPDEAADEMALAVVDALRTRTAR